MSQFMIRAELHGVHEEKDYTRFHNHLAYAGVVRFVIGDDNVPYDLPTGTYAYTAGQGETDRDVAEMVRSIADGLGFRNTVLAIRVESWAALGVTRARTTRVGNLLSRMNALG